ncbi:hypothetical protein B7463_g6995, partial [Scytalidium lignicola]
MKPYLMLMEGIDGIKLLELELEIIATEEHQEESNKSIIAVASLPVPSVKRKRRRPCKYPEIIAFLQEEEPEL